jgi:hypothetical protein
MKDPSTLPDHNIATNRCENISTGEARSRVLEKTSKPTTTAVLKGDDRQSLYRNSTAAVKGSKTATVRSRQQSCATITAVLKSP